MASSYARGAAYERYVCRLMEAAGWSCARHPLSRGAADVDAQRGGVRAMVQVKGGADGRTVGPAGWNRLYDLAEVVEAVPLLANKSGGRWAFWRLTGRKDGRGGRQPMEPYDIGPVGR
jgi:Holliday junction resolvase